MTPTFIIFAILLGISSAAVPHPSGTKHTNTDKSSEILRSSNDVHPDGSYSYEYETSNGISASESGVGGSSAQGRAAWTAPDGTPIDMSYVADENGYQPTGSHIHPIPDAIVRAIEYIRSHPPPDEISVGSGHPTTTFGTQHRQQRH